MINAAQTQERLTLVDSAMASLRPMTESERIAGLYADVMTRGSLPQSRRPVILYTVLEGQLPQ